MTFSLVSRSPDGTALGVAVASKFLAVGSYVTAARCGAGALATQALGNQEMKTKGLDLLASGMTPAQMFEAFFAGDPQQAERQAGVVDAQGRAATYTGARCMPWSGGRAEEHPAGSFAVQGNMLKGPEVVDAMVEAWVASASEPSLARRLVAGLAAGQAAGGDPRGRQSAAVFVVSKGKGYGGLSDIAVDLRADDAPDPLAELQRMLDLHELYFGVTPLEQLLPVDDALRQELQALLARVGFGSGDVMHDLYEWMGRENFEERWHDGALDPVVLAQLKARATA